MNLTGPTATLLLSGGPDSAAVYGWLVDRGWTVAPLFVDYGQAASAREWRAVRAVSRSFGNPSPARLDVRGIGRLMPFDLMSHTTVELGDEYVPQRNLLLCTLAAMHAESIGASAVAVGFVGPNGDGYPDVSKAFARQVERTLRRCAGQLRVLAPFAGREKEDCFTYAMDHDVDLDATWSCALDGEVPCGRCASCVARDAAFVIVARRLERRRAAADAVARVAT